MNYWRSEAKTDTGQSRIAAFNAKREGGRVRFGALVINEHTKSGTYRLTYEGKSLSIVISPEMATAGGTRSIANELWEITHEDNPDH